MNRTPLISTLLVATLYTASLLIVTSWASTPRAANPVSQDENRTRAAFLYRLAFFVTWPGSAFANDDQAISLCIVGEPDNLFLQALQSEILDRQVHGRPLKLESRPVPESLHDCHIVYAAGLPDVTLETQGSFVSVVDSREVLQRTGMLALVRESRPGEPGKLVFHGRRDRIRASPIELSAQLLKLVRFDEQTP